MANEKRDAVEIRRTSNGFIVSKPYSQQHGPLCADDMLVFESYRSLELWLRRNLSGASQRR